MKQLMTMTVCLALAAGASAEKTKRDKPHQSRKRPAPPSSRPAKRIPKTGIPDTKKNRAVIAAVEAYRSAMVRRDAKALASLAHPAYHDDAGTPAPYDDIDRKQLIKVLRSRLRSLKSVVYTIAYRKVGWPKPTRAEVDADITGTYELSLPGGRTRRLKHNDRNRFVLARHRGRWLFLSGM